MFHWSLKVVLSLSYFVWVDFINQFHLCLLMYSYKVYRSKSSLTELFNDLKVLGMYILLVNDIFHIILPVINCISYLLLLHLVLIIGLEIRVYRIRHLLFHHHLFLLHLINDGHGSIRYLRVDRCIWTILIRCLFWSAHFIGDY